LLNSKIIKSKIYIMNQEIEHLIDMAIAGGNIGAKEKEIIFRKAEILGENKDEVDLIIKGKLALLKEKQIVNSQAISSQPEFESQINLKTSAALKSLVLSGFLFVLYLIFYAANFDKMMLICFLLSILFLIVFIVLLLIGLFTNRWFY